MSDGSKRVESKTGRLETQKSAKYQKSFKSKGEKLKKPSKDGNLPNFGATEAGPSFLTPKTKKDFNHLWLAFTKALIL